MFGYSDQPVADTERILGCFFKGLQAARDGVPVSLSAEVIACGGGKLYTGFTDMPERVPGFVSLKEKYKKTPQMVVDYVESLGMKRAEKKYLNFVQIDKAESFENFEGIMFYATPDMLSGLCGWAYFDTNAADAVGAGGISLSHGLGFPKLAGLWEKGGGLFIDFRLSIL